jgi:hypothetical protein
MNENNLQNDSSQPLNSDADNAIDASDNDDSTNKASRDFELASNNKKLLKKQAAFHGGAFISAIALWGAADSWALVSGLAFAQFFLVVASIAFGIVISHISHEWCHFGGALFKKSTYTVKASPALLFFDFNYLKNSSEQFLSMSIGGSVGNFLLILLVLFLIPFDSPGRIMLFSTVVAMSAFVAVIEFAVIRRVKSGEETMAVLADHFGNDPGIFDRATKTGVVTGFGLWALLCLLF